jgi:hypothetical protein
VPQLPSKTCFREQWQAQHADAVVRHAALSDARALAEATLNARVALLYGVDLP